MAPTNIASPSPLTAQMILCFLNEHNCQIDHNALAELQATLANEFAQRPLDCDSYLRDQASDIAKRCTSSILLCNELAHMNKEVVEHDRFLQGQCVKICTIVSHALSQGLKTHLQSQVQELRKRDWVKWKAWLIVILLGFLIGMLSGRTVYEFKKQQLVECFLNQVLQMPTCCDQSLTKADTRANTKNLHNLDMLLTKIAGNNTEFYSHIKDYLSQLTQQSKTSDSEMLLNKDSTTTLKHLNYTMMYCSDDNNGLKC